MNYDKIWSLFNSESISKRGMARIAKMSPSGFESMMERKTMTVETLEVIAEYFKKDVSYFFDTNSYTYVRHHSNGSEDPNKNHYTAPESPVISCDNPACLKRISELEDDKRRLQKYNDLLEAQLARGGLNEGKSPKGGMEESPTG